MNPMPIDLPPLVRQSLDASAAGDEVAALRLLRQAVTDAPQSPLCHFMLGAQLAQDGAVDEAESAMATAVLLAPHFAIARFQLGLLQLSSGRAAQGLLTWQPLLALGDQEPLMHFAQGFSALAADRFDEARMCFERGIGLNPSNEPLNQDIRQVLDRLAVLQDPQHTSPQQAAPSIEHADAQDASATEAAHVLLSNYGGHTHH
jgi:tetratricopeptide (TPR) repeat protein